MPWPKGKKRGPRAVMLARAREAREQMLAKVVGSAVKPTKKRTTKVVVPKVEQPTRKRYSTKLSHPQYSIEQCPNCGFPEADGGYCEECGWSKPVVYGRVS